jgi:hypothetical protein
MKRRGKMENKSFTDVFFLLIGQAISKNAVLGVVPHAHQGNSVKTQEKQANPPFLFLNRNFKHDK